jgi:hypothetical protein
MLGTAALATAAADDADPPDRAARLSYTQGDVSLQPAGVNDWTSADLNRPLTTGDKLWADQNSRAELQVGATAIRLGSATGFSFLNLDDRTAQMQVTAGTLEVHVFALEENENIEIDTPNVALTVLRAGTYRLEVNDAGDVTVVKVNTGEAEITGAGTTTRLHGQQQATFKDTGDPTPEVATLGVPDAFDAWCFERDRRQQEAQVETERYVSPDMTGYEDLADYGTWSAVPDYGEVWVPAAVAVGWAPYRFGHWVWVAPWGWTWVDDAPWGFAPFHYGRWAHVSGSWCWVPGPHHVRPVYAPALVAWVGGPHLSASVTVGGGPAVAWFPLGPREVYVPAYHGSETYVRNVNVTNTTIVNNTYITNVAHDNAPNVRYLNEGAPGAITAVPERAFAGAQPVSSHLMRFNAAELASLHASAPPAVVPVRQSVLGAGAAAGLRVRSPPPALASRPVVARTPPPPAIPSFDRQREAIRANGGRPLAPAQMTQIEPHPAPAPVRSLVTPAAPRTLDRPPQALGGSNATTPGSRNGRPAAVEAAPPAEARTPAAPAPYDRPPRYDRPPTAPSHGPAYGAEPRSTPPVEAHPPAVPAMPPQQSSAGRPSSGREPYEDRPAHAEPPPPPATLHSAPPVAIHPPAAPPPPASQHVERAPPPAHRPDQPPGQPAR